MYIAMKDHTMGARKPNRLDKLRQRLNLTPPVEGGATNSG